MGSSWIDTSGSAPRLKAGAAATGVLGTIIYGWFAGFLGFIDSAGGGITGTFDGAANFVESLWLALPRGADRIFGAAATANAEWLASLGWAGIVVGAAEAGFVTLAILWTVRELIRRATGAP